MKTTKYWKTTHSIFLKTIIVCMPMLTVAYGQTTSSNTAANAPTLGQVIAATPNLQISGYLASTYDHFNTIPALRAFDTSQNGFKFNQLALTTSYLPPTGAGALVTLIAGSDAKVLRQIETWPPNNGAGQFDVNNAYMQYASGSMTLMAGKYNSLAGEEGVNPLVDTNISRSLLFLLMQPATMTGLRFSYAANPDLSLVAGVNNGWDTTSSVQGTSKTLELGAIGSASNLLSYSAAFYSGQSPFYGGNPTGSLQLLDIVANITPNALFNIGANLDFLSKDGAAPGGGKGKASGAALYLNYNLTSTLVLSGRGEYIDDKDGLITGYAGNKLKELTLSTTYSATKNLKLSAEIRQDRVNTVVYANNIPVIFNDGYGAPRSNQTSFEVQAVYAF